MDEWEKEFERLEKQRLQKTITDKEYEQRMTNLERDLNGLEPLYPWLA